jgi:hypothetical protein
MAIPAGVTVANPSSSRLSIVLAVTVVIVLVVLSLVSYLFSDEDAALEKPPLQLPRLKIVHAVLSAAATTETLEAYDALFAKTVNEPDHARQHPHVELLDDEGTVPHVHAGKADLEMPARQRPEVFIHDGTAGKVRMRKVHDTALVIRGQIQDGLVARERGVQCLRGIEGSGRHVAMEGVFCRGQLAVKLLDPMGSVGRIVLLFQGIEEVVLVDVVEVIPGGLLVEDGGDLCVERSCGHFGYFSREAVILEQEIVCPSML